MLDRTVAPAFKSNTHFDLLSPRTLRLSNGLVTHYLIGGQQEVLKIELIVKSGRWFESTAGAAHFAASLLSKGTAKKNSFQIANIFDLYGAHLEITPGLDVVSVALYTLSKNAEPVIHLLVELLTEAAYPDKELQQSKSIYLQNLKVNQEKTSFQASKTFRKTLYGENHPYGKELEEAEVNALTRETVMNHFDRCFKDFFVVVSGNLSEQTERLINTAFSALELRSSKEEKHSTASGKPERINVGKEGSVQSSVRIGKRFIGRGHGDYFDVLLLNHILGGYFGSRLMKNIREDKGLTYGIYSSIHTLINDNYLVIGADVNKENVDLTFTEIRKELQRLREEKIERDELQTARNHFIGSLQGEITTPFSHADKWKNIFLYNLGNDYYQRLINRLNTLDSSDLMNVAQKYYEENSFYEVAVG